MTLAEYLDQAAQAQFAWGAHDCATFPADWVLDCHGLDPMEGVRGSYETQEQAEALVLSSGSLAALWEAGAAMVGSQRTSAPRYGDVGIVELPVIGGPRQIGAIRVNRAWAMLGESGLIVQPARCLAAWRI